MDGNKMNPILFFQMMDKATFNGSVDDIYFVIFVLIGLLIFMIGFVLIQGKDNDND